MPWRSLPIRSMITVKRKPASSSNQPERLGRSAGELGPAIGGRRARWEARQPTAVRADGQRVIGEQPPAEVEQRVADARHLPVEHRRHLEVPVDEVAQAGVAPRKGRALGRRVGRGRSQHVESTPGQRERLVLLGPDQEPLVEVELRGERIGRAGESGPVQQRRVDPMHRGHGVDAAPPGPLLVGGRGLVQPPAPRVGRRVRRDVAGHPGHDPERLAEPVGRGLEPVHRSDRHGRPLAERAHDLVLHRERVVGEHRVLGRRDAGHQLVGLDLSILTPAGVEQDRLVRPPGRTRDGDVVDLHVLQPGAVGEPLLQPAGGGRRVPLAARSRSAEPLGDR